MSMADICNLTAWVLCAVVAFLLVRDFIRTELYFLREKQKDTSKLKEEGVVEDGTEHP